MGAGRLDTAFSPDDLAAIEAAVREVESRSPGEVVPYAADRSDAYPEVAWTTATLGALLSDRFGTRAVVLSGGVLLGFGMVTASQASTLGQFQLLFGVIVGLAAGSFYAPMMAVTTRWFTRHRSLAVALVSSGIGVGSMTVGPLARWIITSYDWRMAMLVIGDLAWLLVIPAALLVRNPPALSTRFSCASTSAGGSSGPRSARSPSCPLSGWRSGRGPAAGRTTRSAATSGSSSARSASASGP